jgi:hypothetical protein
MPFRFRTAALHPWIFAIALGLASSLAWAQAPGQALSPGERLVSERLELTVPQSPGWRLAALSAAHIAIARAGRAPDDSHAAFAMAFRIEPPRDREHFLELVRRGVAADTPPERFTERQAEFRPDDARGLWCVRHAAVHEDRQARLRSGGTGTLTLQALTLYCLHPREPGVAVAFGYSHRGHEAVADFDAEASTFIAAAGLRER